MRLGRADIIADPSIVEHVAALESEALIDKALLLGLVFYVIATRLHSRGQALTLTESNGRLIALFVVNKGVLASRV